MGVAEGHLEPDTRGSPSGTDAQAPGGMRLSPSSMGAFTTCPLAFKFSYIDRLPEQPSAPASKGTLVHRALELLMLRPVEQRTLGSALADLATAGNELSTHPEFAGLDLSDDELQRFSDDSEKLVRRYFDLEDPTTVRPVGLELKLTAELERENVTIRGIIDRLELDPNGDLVVTDYKTGSAPSERWEQRSLAGVHIYSLLCEHVIGVRPARVQLLYLSKPEAIIATPSDQTTRGVRVKSGAVMEAVRRARATQDFRPRPGPLCDYCSFREFCPTTGGNPADARPVLEARQAEAQGRPPLPLDLSGTGADRTPARAPRRDLSAPASAPPVEQPALPISAT